MWPRRPWVQVPSLTQQISGYSVVRLTRLLWEQEIGSSNLVILIWASCTKPEAEPLIGCTNCNAINFDDDANEDDGSCIFINTNRLGDYAVIDSTMDWVLEWWYDEYNISIVRDSCSSVGIKINNYANWITTNLDDSVSVRANIIGDSIFIPYQVVLGYEILETDGYFQEDSIFFKYII